MAIVGFSCRSSVAENAAVHDLIVPFGQADIRAFRADATGNYTAPKRRSDRRTGDEADVIHKLGQTIAGLTVRSPLTEFGSLSDGPKRLRGPPCRFVSFRLFMSFRFVSFLSFRFVSSRSPTARPTRNDTTRIPSQPGVSALAHPNRLPAPIEFKVG